MSSADRPDACPKCDSGDVTAAFRLPPDTWKCQTCGAVWQKRAPAAAEPAVDHRPRSQWIRAAAESVSLELLDKVRKLRVLAQSENVHEAAAAAAAAERIIQEHRIAEAELGDESAEPVEAQILDEFGNAIPSWRGNLSITLEKAHGCAGYVSRKKVPGRRVFVTVGRASDVATVRYLYAWISTEIARLCEAATKAGKIGGRTARNSFCLGAVAGVREAMLGAVESARRKASSEALVHLDARAEAAKAALPEGLRSASRSSFHLDAGAYHDGKRAGASLHAGKAIGGAGGRLLTKGGST